MKISAQKLRMIIREALYDRAVMVHEIRDMGNDRIEEFWGKNKKPEPTGPDKFSDPLGAADVAMGEVVSALWGPWDDSPRPDLLKKAQALHKEIKAAAQELKK
jgi:hypothetical protein